MHHLLNYNIMRLHNFIIMANSIIIDYSMLDPKGVICSKFTSKLRVLIGWPDILF